MENNYIKKLTAVKIKLTADLEEQNAELKKLEEEFADLKLNDSIWFTERDVISSIDFINQNNKSKYFIKNRLFTIEESNYTNFLVLRL